MSWPNSSVLQGEFIFQLQGVKGIIDPGRGALAAMLKAVPPLQPEERDGIILSRGHIDHGNDVNLLIEAITRGGLQKKGNSLGPGGDNIRFRSGFVQLS